MTWLEALWWSRLPQAGGRISRTLLYALSEGVYLTASRRVAALAPLAVMLLGFLTGLLRLGYSTVFTQSLFVTLTAVAIGMVAGQLGASYVLGFAVGDLLRGGGHGVLSRPSLADQLLLHAGLVISYLAMAMLVAGIPLIVRALRDQLPIMENAPDVRVGLEVALGGLVGGTLVYLYVQALPMLIRPLFVWQGRTPTVDAVAMVQDRPWLFALVAAIFVMLRVLAEYGAALIRYPEIERHAANLDASAARPGLWERIPPPVRVVLASALGTIILAGLLRTWVEAATLFGGLLVVNGIRVLVPPLVPPWPAVANRVPVVVRLPAAMVLAYGLASQVLAGRMTGVSFLPLILAFLVGLACLALFFPGYREPRVEESPAVEPEPPGPPPGPVTPHTTDPGS